MNWNQSKDPVSTICLVGTAVVYWSLTQEVAGSNPFTVTTNLFVTEFAESVSYDNHYIKEGDYIVSRRHS